MDDAALNIADTALVTFTFTEAPTNFTVADVSVDNGTLGVIDITNPLIQTVIFTPTNSLTDATNVMAVGTVWSDAAGNPGVGATSLNYSIDTVAPSVAVTMDDYSLTSGETTLVFFTFSEAPTDFTAADITADNGSLGTLNTSNPLIQTALFTPTTSLNDATNVISVSTVWTDAAGNTGQSGSTANFTINTIIAPITSGTSIFTGTINIVQVIINDNGGTKVVADFPLFLNEKPITSGATNSFSFYSSGPYTVTETMDPNYAVSFSGDCDSTGLMYLHPAEHLFCIMTNDDIGAAAIVAPLIEVTPLVIIVPTITLPTVITPDALPIELITIPIAINTVTVAPVTTSIVPTLPNTGFAPFNPLTLIHRLLQSISTLLKNVLS